MKSDPQTTKNEEFDKAVRWAKFGYSLCHEGRGWLDIEVLVEREFKDQDRA